jgi:hypothetical protein
MSSAYCIRRETTAPIRTRLARDHSIRLTRHMITAPAFGRHFFPVCWAGSRSCPPRQNRTRDVLFETGSKPKSSTYHASPLWRSETERVTRLTSRNIGQLFVR